MAESAQGPVDGLALRIEDLGLGHDFDDDSGHGGTPRSVETRGGPGPAGARLPILPGLGGATERLGPGGCTLARAAEDRTLAQAAEANATAGHS
ncbi:hypothetical protein GCM10009570_02380 [Dietzia natronolimnaea]